jgi:hypothetical protein
MSDDYQDMIDILEDMLECCDMMPEGPSREKMQQYIYTLFDILMHMNDSSDGSSVSDDPLPY